MDKERQLLFVWVQESPLSDTDAAGGLDIGAECPDHLTLSEVSRIRNYIFPEARCHVVQMLRNDPPLLSSQSNPMNRDLLSL
jgi:hypothetical protein